MDVKIDEIAIDHISCVWIDRSDDCGSMIRVVDKSIAQNKKNRSLRFEVKEGGEVSTVIIRWNPELGSHVYRTDWYDGYEDKEFSLDCFANDGMIVLRGYPPHELVYFEIFPAK